MRVGLVGAGFMGGVHLNAYAGIPEVEVVGVADARVESAVAGAKIVGAGLTLHTKSSSRRRTSRWSTSACQRRSTGTWR